VASNPPAPEAPYAPAQPSTETFGYGGYRTGEGPWEEWNPTAESIRPVRGKHRVAKQRGGGFARSSTVLGVGVIAAVSAGGISAGCTAALTQSLKNPRSSQLTERGPRLMMLATGV